MKLIVLAHRGEAQSFIKKGDFRPFPLPAFLASQALFKQHDRPADFLFICGEEVTNAAIHLSTILTFLQVEKNSIEQIINYGIAGVLTESLELNQVYSIRTIYGENHFHSYTNSFDSRGSDCISAVKRVKSQKEKERLAPIAQMVDRELWGIAQVANLFKIPWQAFKLSSDLADETVNCEVIREKSIEWSDLLYGHFLQHFSAEKSTTKNESVEIIRPILPPCLDCPSFKFTYAMRGQILTLWRRLKIRDELSDEELWLLIKGDELLGCQVSPKERALKIIQALKALHSPVYAAYRTELDDQLKIFSQQGIKAQFDDEDDRGQSGFCLYLNSELRQYSDFVRLQKKLTLFDWHKLDHLAQGNWETSKRDNDVV